jgi:uncharacterized protein (TIGR03435 family)
LAITVALAQSQTKTAAPKFEVASVKPCRDGDLPPGGRSGGGNGSFSPGTLRIDCTTVKGLINQAYVLFADGHVNLPSRVSVDGGPGWIDSERYRVDAKAEAPQTQGMMHGPMLQALLEERFQLKIHRETREVPVYALTVAKGGPKLHSFQEGSCTPIDLKILEQFPPPPFPELPPGQTYCGGIDPEDGRLWVAALGTMKGPNVTVEARALSIDDFIKLSLSHRVDRTVINKTGITGLFDYHLEYAPDEATPGFRPEAGDPSDPAGQSIFTALQQQLGLKLDPAKGPGEFLVIDRVERPSEN